MRVALLRHGPFDGQLEVLEDLQRALGDRGICADIRPSGREAGGRAGQLGRLADRLLELRGFTTPAAHVPLSTAALLVGPYELVHAYTPGDAAAAHLWKRRTLGPTVFTCTEVLDRPSLADRRLKLRWLTQATQASDAVVAASDQVQAALERWFAIQAPILDLRDADGHAALYRRLAALRA